jgi:Family of unknown function (DUF6524)
MAVRLTGKGLLVRFVTALALVALTWNPSPLNYYRWALVRGRELTSVVLAVGLVLLIAWIVFLRATTRSLGTLGIALAVALAASILWLIVDYHLIDPANRTTLEWVVLILFAAILTAGMSWSHLRRQWAGQADVDDSDDHG